MWGLGCGGVGGLEGWRVGGLRIVERGRAGGSPPRPHRFPGYVSMRCAAHGAGGLRRFLFFYFGVGYTSAVLGRGGGKRWSRPETHRCLHRATGRRPIARPPGHAARCSSRARGMGVRWQERGKEEYGGHMAGMWEEGELLGKARRSAWWDDGLRGGGWDGGWAVAHRRADRDHCEAVATFQPDSPSHPFFFFFGKNIVWRRVDT